MTSWADIDTQLGLLLSDSESQSFETDLRIAAFNRAAEYFAVTHTALLKAVVATATGNGPKTLALPTDLIEIANVGSDNVWLQPTMMLPGEPIEASGYSQTADGLFFPDGSVNIVLVWYWSLYPAIEESSTSIGIPKWAEWAVINLAVAYLLYPMMVGVADLARWKERTESGTPLDNSPREQAKFHIQVYRDIVATVPPQVRHTLWKPR